MKHVYLPIYTLESLRLSFIFSGNVAIKGLEQRLTKHSTLDTITLPTSILQPFMTLSTIMFCDIFLMYLELTKILQIFFCVV